MTAVQFSDIDGNTYEDDDRDEDAQAPDTDQPVGEPGAAPAEITPPPQP